MGKIGKCNRGGDLQAGEAARHFSGGYPPAVRPLAKQVARVVPLGDAAGFCVSAEGPKRLRLRLEVNLG